MLLYVDMRAYLRTYSHVKQSEAALIAVVVSETIQIKDEGSQKTCASNRCFLIVLCRPNSHLVMSHVRSCPLCTFLCQLLKVCVGSERGEK